MGLICRWLSRIATQRSRIHLEGSSGTKFAYALKYNFSVSNNESEYKALIVRLRMTLAMSIEQLIIRGDSKVVFGHTTGSFEANEENMKKYSALAKNLVAQFKATWFEKIDKSR